MLIFVGILVLAIALAIVLQVDDWSRDFTTNRATTSIDSTDPTLRTLELTATVDEVQEVVRRFAERQPAWTCIADAAQSPDMSALSLVRETRWLGFKDDVQVILQATGRGTRVDIESQSRVGKGDLGQNPRNIREILRVIQDDLD